MPKITKKQLQKSNSEFIIAYVNSDKLVYTAQASDIQDYPDLAVRCEMNDSLWNDYTRNLNFNYKSFASLSHEDKNKLSHDLELSKENRNFIFTHYRKNPEYAEFNWADWINRNKNKNLTQLLTREFPGERDNVPYSQLILQHQSQGPQGPTVLPVAFWGLGGQLMVEEDKQSDRRVNIYSSQWNGRQTVHYEMMVEKFVIKCPVTQRQVTIHGGHFQHELKADGYHFDEDKSFAFGHDYHRILMGSIPPRLDALLSYPLKYRIEDAYAATFNIDLADVDRKMTIRQIVGWPIKFSFEFLPRLVADSASWIRDQMIENFPDARSLPHSLLRYPVQGVVAGSIGLLSLIESVGKLTNMILSRISSPIRSFNEAKAIHPLLGIASAILSAGGTVALSLALSPLLPLIGLGGSAVWLTAHLGAVGQFFTLIGAKLSSLMGIQVLPSAAALTTMLSSVYSLIVTPLRYAADRFIQNKKEMEDEPELEEIIEEDANKDIQVGSSNTFIGGLLNEPGLETGYVAVTMEPGAPNDLNEEKEEEQQDNWELINQEDAAFEPGSLSLSPKR